MDTLLALLASAMVANYFAFGSFRNLPIIAIALTMTKNIGIGLVIFAGVICFADYLYKIRLEKIKKAAGQNTATDDSDNDEVNTERGTSDGE